MNLNLRFGSRKAQRHLTSDIIRGDHLSIITAKLLNSIYLYGLGPIRIQSCPQLKKLLLLHLFIALGQVVMESIQQLRHIWFSRDVSLRFIRLTIPKTTVLRETS